MKHMFKKISILTIFLFVFSFNIASAESEYYSNIKKEEIDAIFSTELGDILHPFQWVTERQSYTLIENNNGKFYYWWNVPNIQQIIYNRANNVIPTGFIGSGITPSNNEGLNFIKLPDKDKAVNGMERYGFRIPNIPYIGEYPKVQMSVSGILVESNPVDFLVSKISGLFGGSFVSPPDKKDLKSLVYISPSDYSNDNNSFEKWITKHWSKVVSKMEAGQILIDDKSGQKDGVSYVKETIITNNGLDKLKDGVEINQKLKEILGPMYSEVCVNLLAYGNSIGIENNTVKERIMPYDKEILSNTDNKNLVPDPRTLTQDKITIFGIEIPVGFNNFIKNMLSSNLIDFGGFISEITVFLNSIISFSAFESIGINPVILMKSPIMQVMTVLLAIFLVFNMLKQMPKVMEGRIGISQLFGKAIVTFIALGLLTFMSLSPNNFYNMTKNVSSTFLNMGSLVNENSNIGNDLIDGDMNQKSQANYWLPYYVLWSEYNTGSNINEDKIVLDKNKPETFNMEIPKIGEKKIYLWGANMAQSLTSGSKIDNNIYRTVDHYMAPRVHFIGEQGNLVKTTMNENYNNGIQHEINIGVFMIILIIFVCMCYKVMLFCEAMLDFIMLPVMFTLSTKYTIDKNNKNMFRDIMRPVIGFIRVGLWDIIISMIVFVSTVTTGLLSIIISILIILSLKGFYKYIKNSNSWLRPRLMDFKL